MTIKREAIKWTAPKRLGDLDNAKLIKTESGEFTPFQFRELFFRDAGQFNKMFYELVDKDSIKIQL